MMLDNTSNHSKCSTLDVDLPHKQSVSNCRRRRLQINERRNEYFSDSTRAAEDCHETWYQAEDYDIFRAHAATRSAQLKETCRAYHKLARTLFAVLCDVDFVCNDCSLLQVWTSEVEQVLREFWHEHPDRIGWDDFLVPGLRTDFYERTKVIQDVVAEVQDEHAKGIWTQEEAENELRDCCLNYSQALVLFSQMMARSQSNV